MVLLLQVFACLLFESLETAFSGKSGGAALDIAREALDVKSGQKRAEEYRDPRTLVTQQRLQNMESRRGKRLQLSREHTRLQGWYRTNLGVTLLRITVGDGLLKISLTPGCVRLEKTLTQRLL